MSSGRGLLRNTAVIASLTLVSRILGLVREVVFATLFSTSEVLSAFRTAFMLPNLARRLFGEGALSSALVPVLTQTLSDEGEDAGRVLVGAVIRALTLTLIALIILAEGVVLLWRAIRPDLALDFAVVLLPYMLLICLVAILGGVLNVRGRFAAPAAVPAIMNIAIILAAFGGAKLGGLAGSELMYVICGGVLVAGALQLLVMIGAIRAAGFVPQMTARAFDPRVRQIIKLMLPMALGVSAVQVNAMLDYLVAYWFVQVDGERVGPAVLGYAQYLYQLPLGVFGIALATAIFPVLSARAAAGDREGVENSLASGLRMALFIALPSTVGLIFIARPLVSALYEHGKFDAGDTHRVAGVLALYAAGLCAYFTQHLLVRTFYALKESRLPARIAATMVAVNLSLNLFLVHVLAERGLALSTAVCSAVQVAWLVGAIRPLVPKMKWKNVLTGLTAFAALSALMLAALAGVDGLLESLFDWSRRPIARTLVLVAVGAGTYGLAAMLLRIPEVRFLRRSSSG